MINGAVFVRDIEMENDRKVMMDRIALTEQNIRIYEGKIADTRREVVIEEQRIPFLMADRARYEDELRIARMDN